MVMLFEPTARHRRPKKKKKKKKEEKTKVNFFFKTGGGGGGVPTAPGVPRRSPIQVLTGPDVA